jgi:hypothetical protein
MMMTASGWCRRHIGRAEQAQRRPLVGTGKAMQLLKRTPNLSDRLTCVVVTRRSRKRHLGHIERGHDGYSQDATANFV